MRKVMIFHPSMPYTGIEYHVVNEKTNNKGVLCVYLKEVNTDEDFGWIAKSDTRDFTV